MCIFSHPVERVSNTRIFARMKDARQLLAYEMRVASRSDLAMVLPLPTNSAAEDALNFIDLSRDSEFFDDLERCFPVPVARGFAGMAVAGGMVPQSLVVHQVGAFEASFVPTRAAFDRLDPRFRLSDTVWEQLPGYDDFGFAVFQLRAGDTRVHPMALSFATRDPQALFFPTSHVHDGAVHPAAHFDHSLYAQGESPSADWERGTVLPRDTIGFANIPISDEGRGLVERATPVARRKLKGDLPNSDTWLVVARTTA